MPPDYFYSVVSSCLYRPNFFVVLSKKRRSWLNCSRSVTHGTLTAKHGHRHARTSSRPAKCQPTRNSIFYLVVLLFTSTMTFKCPLRKGPRQENRLMRKTNFERHLFLPQFFKHGRDRDRGVGVGDAGETVFLIFADTKRISSILAKDPRKSKQFQLFTYWNLADDSFSLRHIPILILALHRAYVAGICHTVAVKYTQMDIHKTWTFHQQYDSMCVNMFQCMTNEYNMIHYTYTYTVQCVYMYNV